MSKSYSMTLSQNKYTKRFFITSPNDKRVIAGVCYEHSINSVKYASVSTFT